MSRHRQTPRAPRGGRRDTGVPVQGSIDFVSEVEKSPWKAQIQLDVIEGEDSEHGFDRTWTMQNRKLRERLSWINEYWQ